MIGIVVVDSFFSYHGFDMGRFPDSPDMPDGYFTLMRIFVSVAAVLWAWQLVQMTGRFGSLCIAHAIIVVLYQPFVPIEFHYETWGWINLIVFLFLATELLMSLYIGKKLEKMMKKQALDSSPKARPRKNLNKAPESRKFPFDW
jgi:hypothetical protein